MFDNPFGNDLNDDPSNPFNAPAGDVGGNVGPFGGNAGGSTPNNSEKQKYTIVDFYYLINQKLFTNSIAKDEAPLCRLSYNCDFLNLRIELLSITENTFKGPALIIPETKRITSINLYAETCCAIMANKETGIKVPIFERQFSANNKWIPNQTEIIWNKNSIELKTKDSSTNIIYKFNFTDWQIQAFESSLGFMIDGSAWNGKLEQIIRK